MGGGSETVRSAQVIGLSSKFGSLKKKIMLENGKFISSGMGVVVKAKGQSIVDIKSMYNKKYLEVMGYAPNDNILIDKISEGKVLEYTKNNINSATTYISNPIVNTLGTLDQVILELQDKPNFKRSEMSFIHTDSKKYYYFTAVQNGSYIDVSCYMNSTDTVTPYLENKYPDGYAILNMNTYPLVNNGSVYWKAEVEYTYYEDVIVDEETTVNGQIVIVQKTIQVEKVGLATEYIDCIFIYFTVLDEEEEQMYTIAQQHSGPFTTTGTYIVENDEAGGYTETVTVYGNFTVMYIGNGEFSYDMNAPYPSGNGNNKYRNRAWDNGVYSYQAQKVTQVSQSVIDNVRKLIWDYGVDREDIDGIKRTFALGNIYKSFIVKEQADSYPIIPLKRNFNLVNSTKMDLVLKKIGLEGKDFHDSIRQPEICDAYLFFGIPFSSSNSGLIQYVFEFFTTLSNVRENYSKYAQRQGANSLNISYDGMGIHQNYNVQSWVVVEPAIRPVGTYWFQNVDETFISGYEEVTIHNENGMSEKVMQPILETRTYGEYYYQESEAYYIRVRPMSIQYWYTLGGRQWGSGGGRSIRDQAVGWGGVVNGSDDKIELRLPILKQITNKMDFNLLCDVIEQSMSFAVYTQVTVKKKWYQSGFFQFIMIVVIIVVAYFTGGAALSLLGPVMGVVVAGAIALSALMTIITMLTGTSFGIFGTIVGIVAVVGGGYASLLNSGITLTQAVMFTASQVLNLVSEVNNLLFSMKMGKKEEAYNNQLNQQEQEKEKLASEYEKLYENQGMIVNMFNNFKSLDDIDNYYNVATANFDSYTIMLDYATNYDKFYVTK